MSRLEALESQLAEIEASVAEIEASITEIREIAHENNRIVAEYKAMGGSQKLATFEIPLFELPFMPGHKRDER